MKFTCQQQILSKALNVVSKAVTSRTTIPLLKGFLLQASSDQTLTIAASDLNLTIEKKVNVSVEEEGALVVSARLFGDIIRKLPNEEIEIEEKENHQILIRCRASEFTIVGQPAEEFPHIGEIQGNEPISLNRDLLKDMIKKTSFAASIDETRGIIVGVLIEMEKESLNMVALDGFRMAVTREAVENEEERKIVISSRILNEINKIITEEENQEGISLILDERKAIFFFDGTRVMLRLLDGEFIKYKDLIPKEHQLRVIAERSELLSSIERASLLAKEGKNNLIKFSFVQDTLTITSRSEEGNVKEEIVLQKNGPDLDIGFNSKYILDVLKAIDDDEVMMEFNSSVTPCMIRPLEGNHYEYLVLPVRISSN